MRHSKIVHERKRKFSGQTWKRLEIFLREERVTVGADLNGHVGVGNNGDEDVVGRHGMGERNDEGQAVVDFVKRMELVISNTLFQKKLRRKITYSSGGRNTQVDYILLRRRRLKECSDTKVIIGESVPKQHWLVVSKLIMWTKWRKEVKPGKRTKWWRLKESLL